MTTESKVWICPVCAGTFTEVGWESDDPLVHCMACNHHYPAENGCCHNCGSPDLYAVVPTTLTITDDAKISDWAIKNDYRRGTCEFYDPGTGEHTLGGIPIRNRRRQG